jgi:hypothetical protein
VSFGGKKIGFVEFGSGSRNSSVSVVTELRSGRSGVQIPVAEEDSCLLNVVQADCGIYRDCGIYPDF